MKILLLGDYSNYSACLATALARAGHSVTVASDGSGAMNTSRTINLARRVPGRLGGALLYVRMLTSSALRGYDVVSLISPSFMSLRPQRLRVLFDRLRRHNGAVYLNACGTDKAYMDMMTSADCPLRYTEYTNPDGSPRTEARRVLFDDFRWQQGAIGDFCEYVYDKVDGVTTALYEYNLAMHRRLDADRVAYVGIPIDLEAVKPLERPLVSSGKVNMFLGRKSQYQVFKGTDRIGRVAEQVAADYPDLCTLTIVEDRPYAEYVSLLRQGDIVLDQLYSYSPATNALLAMAAGQAVLSGGEPEYYNFIGEHELRPIINAVPDEDMLYRTLAGLVRNPERIKAAGAAGRSFVERHNSADLVATRCLDFWMR